MALGSIPRRDGRDKVTGTARYTENIQLPGMLQCALLRSPVPHARLMRVDASRAEALPGVVAVLTRDDLGTEHGNTVSFGPALKDHPVVATERVRFVGDVVAAVAAETKDIARQALDLIEVEYEELPGVYDAFAAIQPGAPLLHENLRLPLSAMADLIKTTRPIPGTNIANHFHVRKGDVEIGKQQADLIVEGTFRLPNVQHAPMETHATVAAWDGDDRLSIWSSTQTPYMLRQQLAELFMLSLSQVRVVVPYLGGAFGAKTYPKLEPVVAALARKARRPVKLQVSREEEFLVVTRHAVTVHMKTGVRKDGTLVFREAETYWDTGAYADIGPRLIMYGAYGANGPYKIPHVKVDAYCVYTNKPPSGAFRGYGVSKVAFAYEVQMDEIAHLLGRDPVDLRRQNLLHNGDAYATGEIMEHVTFEECVSHVAEAIDWTEPAVPSPVPVSGKVFGKGLAVINKGTVTPSTSSASIKVNEDGSVHVLVSTVEMGQGAETVMGQMAAEALGVPVETVMVSQPDTDFTPYDLTTSSSRSTYSMGNAIRAACEDAKRQLLELAAPELGVDAGELEIQGGLVRSKADQSRSIPLSHLMRTVGGRLGSVLGRGSFSTSGGLDPDTGQGRAAEFWSASAGAAEVEVDVETGQVKVLRYASAVHSGTPINPALTKGQSEGSVIMGLGLTMMEELKFQDGQPVNASFLDYHVPSMVDIPAELDPHMVEEESERGPFGAKGMGETDLPHVAGAVSNAIYNACGVRLRELPFTPDKVLAGLKALREGR